MEEMKRNESQSTTNKSMGTISTTNGFSTTPITRPPRSEENEGTGGGRGGQGGRHYRQGLQRRKKGEWRPKHEVGWRWGEGAMGRCEEEPRWHREGRREEEITDVKKLDLASYK